MNRFLSWIALFTLFCPAASLAQEAQETNPKAALTAALVAACRQSDAGFARYLTADNAKALLALPDDQRKSVMSRFVALPQPGRPLLSDAPDGRTVVRCDTPSVTGEIRIGDARQGENLAFVPVEVVGTRSTEFGMIREGGGWRILSLGLLLINIPELAKQWAEQDLRAREEDGLDLLRGLGAAILAYREGFGRLPERLEQLGPPPENRGVSPESADLVDKETAAGEKLGYRFRYRIVPVTEGETKFEVAATPVEYGKTGRRSFLLDAAGRLHGADKQGGVASPADPLVEPARRP